MKYRLAEHVSFTEVDNEAVLLDLNTGTYYGLNEVGTHFLNIVRNTSAANRETVAASQTEQATQEIAALYHINEDQVRTDLLELIEQLEQSALLCSHA